VSDDDELAPTLRGRIKDPLWDNMPAEAPTRLDYELGVLKKTGFSSYFLIRG